MSSTANGTTSCDLGKVDQVVLISLLTAAVGAPGVFFFFFSARGTACTASLTVGFPPSKTRHPTPLWGPGLHRVRARRGRWRPRFAPRSAGSIQDWVGRARTVPEQDELSQ